MDKLKLLIVGAFPPPESKVVGGIITACRHLINSPFSTEFDLLLVDTTQLSNPAPGMLIRACMAIKRFWIFVAKIFFEKPNGVILFVAGEASIAEKGCMAWLCRPLNIPIFIFPRGARIIEEVANSRIHGMWIPFMMRGATHFLCQGETWRKFATKVVGFPIDRTKVIPNWTADGELLSIGYERVHRENNHVPVILFLGWLEKTKGIFELLEVCNRMGADLRFELRIAGRGHAEQEVRSYISTHKLERIVRLVGWAEGEIKKKLLRESDILALPSWAEGLPNAMIEAMAAKLYVVISAVGAIPDYITNGDQALLVMPKSVDELEKALRMLIEDQITRENIASRGQKLVKERFSIENGVEKLGAYLTEVMLKHQVKRTN